VIDGLTLANQIACHISGARVLNTDIDPMIVFGEPSSQVEVVVSEHAALISRRTLVTSSMTNVLDGKTEPIPLAVWHSRGSIRYGKKTMRGIAKAIMRRAK
jgi:hypothetical protein